MNVYYKELNKSSIGNNHFYVGWSPIKILLRKDYECILQEAKQILILEQPFLARMVPCNAFKIYEKKIWMVPNQQQVINCTLNTFPSLRVCLVRHFMSLKAHFENSKFRFAIATFYCFFFFFFFFNSKHHFEIAYPNAPLSLLQVKYYYLPKVK